MWWETWVEMVIYPAPGQSACDITWHCSIKQHLKSPTGLWFKVSDSAEMNLTHTPMSIPYPTKAHKGILQNCLTVWKSTQPLPPPGTESTLQKCSNKKWNESWGFWHQRQLLCMLLRSSQWPISKCLGKTKSLLCSQQEACNVWSWLQGHSLICIHTEVATDPPTWLKLTPQF